MPTESVVLNPQQESNQEQFQRWVEYVNNNLWPKLEILIARCKTLYEAVAAESLKDHKEIRALEEEYASLVTYAYSITEQNEIFRQTFQNKDMAKYVTRTGHYIMPYVVRIRMVLDVVTHANKRLER